MMDTKINDLAIIFQITQETVRRYINNYEKFRTIRSKSCNAGTQPILNPAESIAIDKHLIANTYTKIKGIQHYIRITYSFLQ